PSPILRGRRPLDRGLRPLKPDVGEGTGNAAPKTILCRRKALRPVSTVALGRSLRHIFMLAWCARAHVASANTIAVPLDIAARAAWFLCVLTVALPPWSLRMTARQWLRFTLLDQARWERH
ncbi:MAG: hypothetical protein J7M39_13325, partial [Anaerolineae bacterium]|nr:hypothetical protein [Anaerolineae bacterium]